MNANSVGSTLAVSAFISLASLAMALGACAWEAKCAAELQHVNLEQQDRLQQSSQLVTGLRAHIPDEVASRTRCILVVPASEKGRIVLGGEGGKGFATCLSGGVWSYPAPVDVSAKTGFVGAWIGHESTDVVAVVVSAEAEKTLESGKLEFEDPTVKAGVFTYAHANGRFDGIALKGLTVSSDARATQVMYGDPDFASVLERRATPPPGDSVKSFLGTVNDAFAPKAP
jgi:lipid-binding SYLF domain-containing protein